MARRANAGQLRRDQSEDRRDRSVRNGEYVWVSSPAGAKIKVKAKVTEGVGPDTVFHPVPLSPAGGRGQDMLPFYPEGARADRARRRR
jgi:anaerobic selenocysteine-containing dehydrogenase